MQHQSDAQLLRDYAAHGSEPAFAALVTRHTDLVYSAALRQTASPELAREITQSVFTDLACKARALAGTLSADASLAGWLFRGTRFAGLKLLRDDHRRQTRERQFMEHFHPAAQAGPEGAPGWEQVAPVLDEAMAELDDADHEAVLLRYFKNQDFHAVALALGVSDAAAQKRVSRAVERLRDLLAKRGVTASAGGLVILISTNAILIAPAGLSAAIITTALAGTTIATTAIAIAAKTIVMTTLQKTIIAAALAAAVGVGIYEASQASTLRTQLQTLQQQAPLIAQIPQLTSDRDDAMRQLAALRADNERLTRDQAELLRLRGEVTRLRRENQTQKPASPPRAATTETTRPVPVPVNAGEYIVKDQLAFAGYATPEATMQSMSWAMVIGNYEATTNALSPKLHEEGRENPNTRDSFERGVSNVAPRFKGMQILARKDVADEQVEIKVKWDFSVQPVAATGPGPSLGVGAWNSQFLIQPMVKVGNEWKIGGSSRRYTDDWDKSGTVKNFVP